MSAPQPDESIGRYLLLERLGTGGLGEVFRARDSERGRTVVLKLLPPEVAAEPARREAFLQEARAAAELSHPSIAVLYEAGEDGDRLFAAFEFVQGETLRAAMAGGAMPPRRAVPIAIQVADALAEGHAAGIIHRDLRPETIIVTPKGAAKLLEFGLANWTRGGAARQEAATRGTVSTPEMASPVAYMSPEQVLAQPLDARTDVFSLGVVLYEMLTGRNPFAGEDASGTLVNILRVQPEPPSRSNPEVPPEVDALVMRMLARDVRARPEGAANVASALREAFGERTEHIIPIEPELEAVRPPSRGRTRAGLWTTAVLLLLIVAAAGLTYPKRDALRGWWRHQFGPPPQPNVIVLPFADQDGRRSAFANALTADLTARLGQAPGLRVTARGVPGVLRGRPVPEIARRSGAAVALAGTVRRDAGELNVVLELIDGSDGVRIWRREFINPEGSVFAAETLMVEEISRALRVPVTPGELRERSLSRFVAPEAYETYARAREAMALSRYAEAEKLFDEATSLDGGLAEAYAGLAEATYLRVRHTPGAFTPAVQSRVRDAAARAAAIEPDLAAVHLAGALGAADFRESLARFVRAAALDPQRADTYFYLADRIRQVDPARADALNALANRLHMGTLPVPRETAAPASHQLAEVRRLLARNEAAEARAALAKILAGSPDSCEARAVHAGLLMDERKGDEARAVAAPLTASPVPACAAVAAAALGDAASAAATLRQVSADPQLLRMWMQPVMNVTAQAAIDEKWYPWPKVLDTPQVAGATAELQRLYAEMKTIAGEALQDLPQ